MCSEVSAFFFFNVLMDALFIAWRGRTDLQLAALLNPVRAPPTTCGGTFLFS